MEEEEEDWLEEDMYSGEEDVEEISDEEAQAPAAAEDAAGKEDDKKKKKPTEKTKQKQHDLVRVPPNAQRPKNAMNCAQKNQKVFLVVSSVCLFVCGCALRIS